MMPASRHQFRVQKRLPGDETCPSCMQVSTTSLGRQEKTGILHALSRRQNSGEWLSGDRTCWAALWPRHARGIALDISQDVLVPCLRVYDSAPHAADCAQALMGLLAQNRHSVWFPFRLSGVIRRTAFGSPFFVKASTESSQRPRSGATQLLVCPLGSQKACDVDLRLPWKAPALNDVTCIGAA